MKRLTRVVVSCLTALGFVGVLTAIGAVTSSPAGASPTALTFSSGSNMYVAAGSGSNEVDLTVDFSQGYANDTCEASGTPGVIDVTATGSSTYASSGDYSISVSTSVGTVCVVLPAGSVTGDFNTNDEITTMTLATGDTTSDPYAFVSGCALYGFGGEVFDATGTSGGTIGNPSTLYLDPASVPLSPTVGDAPGGTCGPVEKVLLDVAVAEGITVGDSPTGSHSGVIVSG